MRETAGPPAVPDARRRLRLLQLAALTSTCDRFALAPLLVTIAADLEATLAQVAAVASAYFLAYGLMQAVWGFVGDRIGRVRVMRIALAAAAAAGLGSALAPDLLTLAVTRTVAGGCFAALIPAALVYVGDTWADEVRQRPLSEVLAASSLGVAAATAGAGLLADVAGWRPVPAITAAAAAVAWWLLARLPEPDRPAAPGGGPLRAAGRVLGSGWARVVLLLALVEGALVLGAVTYLSPAAQALGATATVAGAVAAGFGVGAVVFARLVRALVGRVAPAGLAAIGGGLLVAGLALPATAVHLATLAGAGLLAGGAWAFLHSTLQGWATAVAPRDRATAVALFATALFAGSAAGTAAAARLADAGAYDLLFRAALGGAVPFVVATALARYRYARR